MTTLEPAVATGTVALQVDDPARALETVDLLAGAVWGAVGAFVTTLVVGAIMRALAPDYTDARMADLRREPVGGFLYGLACLVFLVLASIVLILTFVGILLAVPLLLAAYVVWAVGSAIAHLVIADGLVGHEDGWTTPLLVAGAIAGGLTLTGIGGLLSFAIGAAGFGVVLREYLA